MSNPTIKIEVPKIFSGKKEKLEGFTRKYNPILILEKLTGRKLKKDITFQHRPLKKEARFKDYKIFADFNNEVKYLWICICHELAHILLENPLWYKNKQIEKIIKESEKKISKYKKCAFEDAIEQTLAILLQAACEDKANIRKLRWSERETTFDYMKVKKFGEKLWRDWLEYLKDRPKYKNIEQWILKEIKLRLL